MEGLYTRCPHCQTVFRLDEAQLNAAEGQVRCGACFQVFDARQHSVKPSLARPAIPVMTANEVVDAELPADDGFDPRAPWTLTADDIFAPLDGGLDPAPSEPETAPDFDTLSEGLAAELAQLPDALDALDVALAESSQPEPAPNEQTPERRPSQALLAPSAPVATPELAAHWELDAAGSPPPPRGWSLFGNVADDTLTAPVTAPEPPAGIVTNSLDDPLLLDPAPDADSHAALEAEVAQALGEPIFSREADSRFDTDFSSDFDADFDAELRPDIDTGVADLHAPAQTPQTEPFVAEAVAADLAADVAMSADDHFDATDGAALAVLAPVPDAGIDAFHTTPLAAHDRPAPQDSSDTQDRLDTPDLSAESAPPTEAIAPLEPFPGEPDASGSEPAPGAESASANLRSATAPASPAYDWRLDALDRPQPEAHDFVAPRAGWLAKLGWTAVALALLALLAGQWLWHQRLPLRDDPRFGPWIEQLCIRLDCRLPPKTDLAAVRLLERSVLKDGRNNQLLNVELHIENRAGFVQPFPDILLRFTNIDGKVVAERRFKPAEYLREADAPAQMPINVPIRIGFAVLDPAVPATGFEFHFLPARP